MNNEDVIDALDELAASREALAGLLSLLSGKHAHSLDPERLYRLLEPIDQRLRNLQSQMTVSVQLQLAAIQKEEDLVH